MIYCYWAIGGSQSLLSMLYYWLNIKSSTEKLAHVYYDCCAKVTLTTNFYGFQAHFAAGRVSVN